MDYDIAIENKRKLPITLYNLDGTKLCTIGQSGDFAISTDDPYKMLARYDRIVFTEKGVDLSIRPGWTEPERKWPVTVEMKDGPAVEHRFFDGSAITLMKGFSYILDCPPQDEWAIFSHVLLNVGEQKRIESSTHDGVYEFINVLTDQPTLRTDAELDRLQREIEAAAVAVPSEVVMTPEEQARVAAQEDIQLTGDTEHDEV